MADPLFDAAVQAGFFPGYTPPVDNSEVPMDINTFLASQGAGPGVTRPGQLPVPTQQGPVDSPSESSLPPSAPTAQPSASSSGVKAGERYSQSTRGYSEAQMGKVSKQDAPLEQSYQRAEAEGAASGEPQFDAASMARDSGVLAAQAQTHAGVAKITAEGHQALLMKGLSDSFAADEMQMNMEAQAKSDQAKADYMGALADFRASRVDPGQLWGNMTPSVRFGTLASVFVHDFLGAKGIKTSAMDTLNMAIDRNINAQVQGIKTKGEVADGFKSLWYMQRNQSASDVEARQRVRGFLLEGAKQQIISNMSQYEAGLATAQGQAAIAAIDKELAKNLIEIHRHIDTNILQRRQQALSWHEAKLQAAVQSASTSVARDRLNWEKNQALKSGLPNVGDYIPDTTPSGEGKLKWKFYAGEPAKRDEIRDKLGKLNGFQDKVMQMQALAREIGALPQTVAKELLNEKQRQLLQLRDAAAYDIAYAKSGKAINQAEVTMNKERFPIDKWMQRGGTEKQIAQTARNLYLDVYGEMAPYVMPIPEGDPFYGIKMTDAMPAPGQPIPGAVPGSVEVTEQDRIARRGSIETGPTEVATQALARPDKWNAVAPETLSKLGVGEEAASDWETFKNRSPDQVNRYERSYDSGGKDTTPVDEQGKPLAAPSETVSKVPAGGAAVVALRKQAVLGDNNALSILQQRAFPENEGLVDMDANEQMLKNFARLELLFYTEEMAKKAKK